MAFRLGGGRSILLSYGRTGNGYARERAKYIIGEAAGDVNKSAAAHERQKWLSAIQSMDYNGHIVEVICVISEKEKGGRFHGAAYGQALKKVYQN